jgi:hypothetical protein
LSAIARVIRRAFRRGFKGRSDAGVTHVELLVGMTIMTIFMSMFTASVVMMYKSTSKAEAIGNTASQLSMAFTRLDKSVRYASAITEPAQGADNNWYVEWLSTFSGTAQCTRIRLNVAAGQLQQRTWTVDSSGSPSAPSDWIPLASNLQTGGASDPQPLTRVSDPNVPYQQLRIYLIAQTVGQSGPTKSVSDVTFTAFNTSVYSPNFVCGEWSRG